MRPPDWEARLRSVLLKWQAAECSRRAHCGDFGGDVVEAVQGRDVRPLFEARTPAEVAAVYRRHGARSLADVVTAILGAPVPVRAARRGDLVQAAHDPGLGVCLGDKCAFLHHGGLKMLPLHFASRAWRLD